MRTALEVADALGPRLWGVRLDTASTMVDRSLWHEMGRFRPDRRGARAGVEGAPRARRRRPRRGADRRLGRLRRPPHPRLRGGRRAGGRLRRRHLPAAAARTTSPPTSCASTASPARRSGATSAPTRASSSSSSAVLGRDPSRRLRRRRHRRGARPAGRDVRPDAGRARGHGGAGGRGRALRPARRRGRADPAARPRGRDRPLPGQPRRGPAPRRVRGATTWPRPSTTCAAAAPSSSTSGPRPGLGGHLVAFVHPRSAGGVLTELVQAEPGGGH